MARLFLRCCVIGCSRIRGQRKRDTVPIAQQIEQGWWWICGDHWRTISVETKKRYRDTRRVREKALAQGREMAPFDFRYGRAVDRLIAEATELAMGI